MNEEAFATTCQEFTDRNIITSANELVDHLLKNIKNIDDEEDPATQAYHICQRKSDDGEDPIDVSQYWIVTEYLADKLEAAGEPVDYILGFHIWGRIGCGMAVWYDQAIKDSVEDLYDFRETA